MINFDKPVQTIRGKSVNILTTQGPDVNFPIVGHIKGNDTIRSWSVEGKLRKGAYAFNIQNAPPLEDFVMDVVDGNGRVMAHIVASPEEDTLSIEVADGITLFKDGRNVDRYVKPVVTTKPTETTAIEGDLASAFFKQFASNSNSTDIELEE